METLLTPSVYVYLVDITVTECVYFYEILSLCHQFFPPWRDPSGQKILASGGLKGNQIVKCW